MKQFLSILFLLATFASFTTAPEPTLEEEKYLNYVFAMDEHSIIGFFIVVKVKDVNTGKTKEICTKAKFLRGALHKELNIDYSDSGIDKVFQYAKNNKNRYFEFKNSFALNNIDFTEYKPDLQLKLKLKYNFRSICKEIESKKEYSKRLEKDEMEVFAHILFNKGFLTSESNCWGGTLRFADRKNRK